MEGWIFFNATGPLFLHFILFWEHKALFQGATSCFGGKAHTTDVPYSTIPQKYSHKSPYLKVEDSLYEIPIMTNLCVHVRLVVYIHVLSASLSNYNILFSFCIPI